MFNTNNPTSTIDLTFFIGIGIGFVLGVIVGFLIALRSKRPESKLTAIQIFSVITFFGYIVLSFVFNREVSWIIAIAILATGYGARGGAIIEKVLERNTK
jgi:NhaP-type Na+/H+ or K+/H+ antiporter